MKQQKKTPGLETPGLLKVSGSRMKLAVEFAFGSSKDSHDAAKAAGRAIEVTTGYRTSENSFDFGGMMFLGGTGIPVTGNFPAAWIDFLESQKTKAGRPKNKMEESIAKFLSVQNFLAQGHGVEKSRVLAAGVIARDPDPEAAKKKYLRAERDVLKSEVLKDFDRCVVLHDKCVMLKHKTAIVDVGVDGVRLSGIFWMVKIGSSSAELGEFKDCFLAFVPGTFIQK